MLRYGAEIGAGNMRRAIRFGLVITLVMAVVLGQIAVAQSQIAAVAVGWSTATVAAAAGGITTAVNYALAGCAAYCSTAWSAVTIAASATAEIAAMALFYGVQLGLAGVAVYLLYKGLTWANGHLLKPGPVTYAPSSGALGVGSYNYSTIWVEGVRPTYDLAVSACAAFQCPSGQHSGGCTGIGGIWLPYFRNQMAWSADWSPYGMQCQNAQGQAVTLRAWMTNSTHPDYVISSGVPVPISQVDLKTMIETDLAGTNGQEAQTKAQGAAIAMAKAIAPSYPGTDTVPPPLGLTNADWARVATILSDAAGQAIATKLAAYDDAKKGVPYVPNPQTADMTKTDVRDAVRDGAKEALDSVEKTLNDIKAKDTTVNVVVNVPPVDYTPPADGNVSSPGGDVAPALTPVSAKLDTFYNAISSLPVLSLITSLSVNAVGGSPTVQMTIPGFFGGSSTSKTLDFSNDSVLGINYLTVLTMLGNLMLAMCGVHWVKYLFEG